MNLDLIRRNLEASYIALLRTTLNEQKDFEILTLFRNGVTHRKIFTLSKLLVIFYTLKYDEFITY